MITDFEAGFIVAAQTELPNTQVAGCYFHFCQSLWRKIQSLGLAAAYSRINRLRVCIRKFMALGFLPLALMRNNFQLHANNRSTRRLVRHYPELNDFIIYFENNYMDGQGFFPPRMWNVFTRNCDTRTNNHVEGMNTFPPFKS